MSLLLFPSGPAAPAGVDIAAVITDLLPALGATSPADLDWCSQAELYQFADEAAMRLAGSVGGWVERIANPSATAAALQSTPTGHVDTLHVSWNQASLRPTSAAELASLDPDYLDTPGTPQRFSMDAAGAQSTFVLYPSSPTTAGQLAIIFHKSQPTIQPGSSILPLASPVGDYFTYAMLAEARRKESDACMPEMAAHFDERVGLYESILKHYFGESR